jgi:hypothetical protein
MSIDMRVLALCSIGLFHSGLSYASDVYDCPSTVRLASASVAPEDVPAGFEPRVSDSIIRLSGNNLYDGPPENRGQLKPDFAKGDVATWTLTPGKYPQGVWISCDYAQGLVKIVARTKESVTSCSVTTKKVKPYNTLTARFVCN